jgi:hypothetical protein
VPVDDNAPATSEDMPAGPGPDVPPLVVDLAAHLHGLYESPAPAFPTTGTPLRSSLKRAVNVALRAVGLSQRRFNEAIAVTLTMLLAELRGLRGWLEERAPLLSSAPDLGAALADMREEVDALRAAVAELRGEARGAPWSTGDVADRAAGLPAPRIVDEAAYTRRIADMPDGLRVILACGAYPSPTHLNVDWRPSPGVDIVADLRRLPFEAGTVAELAAAHVDRFPEHQFRTRVLPYWRTLLRPHGCLRMLCTDWEALLERLADGRATLADVKAVAFDRRSPEGYDVVAIYSPGALERLVRSVGFRQVEVRARDHAATRAPELEVVARP